SADNPVWSRFGQASERAPPAPRQPHHSLHTSYRFLSGLAIPARLRTRFPSLDDGVLIRIELHAHVAQLGVELERMHAAFTADTGVLRSAKGRAKVAQEPAVDPADSHVDLGGDAVGPRKVGCPHGRGESVLRVVGHAHRFGLGVEGLHVTTRAEDLLL